LTHCMTRVRITIKDDGKVDKDTIQSVDGVLGLVEDEGSLQVVVGPGTAGKVANIMVDDAGVRLGEPFQEDVSANTEQTLSDREKVESKAAEVKAEEKAKHTRNSKFKQVLKTIANIFITLIPAFVGAGIVGGIASVLSNMLEAGTISTDWETIINTLTVILMGLYSYLPIFVGINAATVFGATPGLGGV